MPPNLPGNLVQSLRRTVLVRDDAALTDGQLLERYLRQRDEAAFAALVHRHGPMVWGVCRRTLVHDQDAEDAFQATFLVLVRKAASVRPRELVGNWLHGVACRVAMSVRRGQARHRQRERQVAAMPEPAAPAIEPQGEMETLLDVELGRLPEKYRIAIVLCDLAGRTRKEVARQLGIPEGTLSGRLSRGRALLARRLARSGLAVSAMALVPPTSAAPAAVVSTAIRLATGPATLVPARVSALVEGVLKAMLISKLRFATLVLLSVALLGAAVGIGQWATTTDAGEKAGQAVPADRAGPGGPAGHVGQVVQAPKAATKPRGDTVAPSGQTDFEVFRLKYAKAADMAKTLDELLQGFLAPGLRIVADPGSNSVLVRGPRDQYRHVAAIIDRLDRNAGQSEAAPARAMIRVFSLKYAKAVDLAKTLRDLLQGTDAPGLRIAADPGSNSVLVRGREDQIEEALRVIERLEEAAGSRRLEKEQKRAH